MHRLLLTAALLASLIISVSACGATGGQTTATVSTTHSDPRTVQALLQIARRFNNEYAANDAAAAYDRWDGRSRLIIDRAAYIRRHQECPTAPGPATVQGAAPAGRWWLVHYAIAGTELTDYWQYDHGRWEFDLVRSNPQAVRLYRLPAARYFAAVGCKGHV
jgi:hypothetical protein